MKKQAGTGDLFDGQLPEQREPTKKRARRSSKKSNGLVKVGDVPLVRDLAPTSKRQLASADELAAIWSRPGGKDDATYLHTVLCHVSLPRKPVTGLEYEQRYRNAHLLITAGKLYQGQRRGYVQQCVPFGVYARLLFNIFSAKAVKTQSPVIEIGKSRAEFMRDELHMDLGGTNANLLMRQLNALVASTIQLGGQYDNGRIISTQGKPFSAFEAWPDDENQRMLWPGHIAFSAEHFQGLMNGAAVPLDHRHVLWLSKNGGPLAMDILYWLSQRLVYVTERNGVPIGWLALKEQFGQSYTNLDSFRRDFQRAVKSALMVYREAKVEIERGGIRLFYSRPPIPPSFRTIVSRLKR